MVSPTANLPTICHQLSDLISQLFWSFSYKYSTRCDNKFLQLFIIVHKYHNFLETMKYAIVKATKYYKKNTVNEWTTNLNQALILKNLNYAQAITDKFGGEILPVEE